VVLDGVNGLGSEFPGERGSDERRIGEEKCRWSSADLFCCFGKRCRNGEMEAEEEVVEEKKVVDVSLYG